MGILYVVATPIGNLGDITLRALKVLETVDFIACEDTRTAAILIKHYFKEKHKEMFNKLFSYFEQNELQKILQVLNILENGKNVALISESGTPAISDPGFKLIREALQKGIRVESIPGPSSAISALVSSGLPTDKFLFLGFLPKKPGHRLTVLKKLKDSLNLLETTVIIYESPFRLIKTLGEIKNVFGDIEVVVARELTKFHEEVKKDTITNLCQYFAKGVKGEIVILFSTKT